MKTGIKIFLFFSCFQTSLFQIIKQQNLKNFDYFIEQIINITLNGTEHLNETLKNQCINSNLTKKPYDLIKYSGKDLGDVGNEKGCININATPVLIRFKFNTTNSSYYEKNVLKFLEISTYFIGICVLDECIDFLKNEMLDYEKNPTLFEKFGKIYGADLIDNTMKEKVQFYYPTKNADNSQNLPIKIIIIISLLFLLFKIIFALIRVVFFSTFTVHRKSLFQLKTIKKRVVAFNDSDEIDYSEEYIFPNPFSMSSTLSLEDNLNKYLDETKKPSYYRFISSFEIINDLNLLFTAKNKYYSEEGIEILATMRFFIMISELWRHSISSSRLIPGRDCFNQNFYSSILFSFAKISNYSFNLWMIIDSAVMCFKFLSYLKKQIQTKNFNYPTISMFLWFFLRIIPKVFLFLIIFFVYTYNAESLKPFIGSSNLYDYLINYYFNKKDCYTKNPLIMFNPNFFDENQNYNKCFKFTYFTINQFYSFLLFLIIMYMVFQIRKNIFDYLIIIALLVNTGLSILSCNLPSDNYQYYLERFHQGATQNVKKIYLFFNTYFIGVLVGFCFFYYSDTISNKPLYLTMDYTPFEFCLNLIGFLDKLSLHTKFIILAGILLLLGIFSMYFSILVKIEGTLLVSFSPFRKYLFIYENYFICLLFSFMCIMLLVIPKENFLGRFFKSDFFNFLNRTSSACFYLFHTIFYFAYALGSLNLKVTYINVAMQSTGLLILIVICSILFTLIYELILRIAVKKIDWHFNDKEYVEKESEEQGLSFIED